MGLNPSSDGSRMNLKSIDIISKGIVIKQDIYHRTPGRKNLRMTLIKEAKWNMNNVPIIQCKNHDVNGDN
jgi:hypothetical protein